MLPTCQPVFTWFPLKEDDDDDIPKTQVPTINRTDQTTDWFSSLQRCFNWSDRVDQKPLQPHDVDVQQALIRQYSNSMAGLAHGEGVDPTNGAPIDSEWSAAGLSAGTHAAERWTSQRVVVAGESVLASSDSGQSSRDDVEA